MKLEGAEGGVEGGWQGGVWCSCIWSQEPQAWYQRVCQIDTALSVAALSISTPSRHIPLSTPPPGANGRKRWERANIGLGCVERVAAAVRTGLISPHVSRAVSSSVPSKISLGGMCVIRWILSS